MAKTQEELNVLKQEYETLNNKLKELSEDELKEVTGGSAGGSRLIYSYDCPICGGTHTFYCSPLNVTADVEDGCSATSYIYGISSEGDRTANIIVKANTGEAYNTTAKIIGHETNGQSYYF